MPSWWANLLRTSHQASDSRPLVHIVDRSRTHTSRIDLLQPSSIVLGHQPRQRLWLNAARNGTRLPSLFSSQGGYLSLHSLLFSGILLHSIPLPLGICRSGIWPWPLLCLFHFFLFFFFLCFSCSSPGLFYFAKPYPGILCGNLYLAPLDQRRARDLLFFGWYSGSTYFLFLFSDVAYMTH